MKKTILFALVSVSFFACQKKENNSITEQNSTAISADSARAIAKDAWIYGYPIFYNYKTVHAYALDKNNPDGAKDFNTFKHYSKSFTSADTTIVTPNNDTPYSWAILNLSDEPIVIDVPEIKDKRYYVMQLIDAYTYNFAYIGSRATGNKAGRYLIAGPNWKGKTPAGINKVFTSETNLVTILGRTEMDNLGEESLIKKIQSEYHLIPLHDYTKTAAPMATQYNMPLPAWNEADYKSLEFINVLNSLLQYTVPDKSEKELLARFAKIGINPGVPFDKSKFSPEILKAIGEGIAEGGQALKESIGKTTNSLHLFGSRADLKNDYVIRATAAAMGIYGNTKEEAVYIGSMKDSDGVPMNAANKYVIHFSKRELPPVGYFWSITMYNLPQRNLVKNPINRYSIGDRTKGLKYDVDGGLTLYLQTVSPGKNKESNWLPAPEKGGMTVIVRLYGPEKIVTSGEWKMPFPKKVN
ncbi:MAG TPA: DUF1254 domain-containing protein [Flavobacterium sp.]|nr:DUF1254 domain-containing protein [Flavobacterium sp.]